MSPREILRVAVESYVPLLQPSGELFDPVIGEPTQYGTAYHALCNAIVALDGGAGRATDIDRAARGLDAALHHVEHPELPATVSGMGRERGTTWRGNHRDFFWPPILKTYLILKRLDPDRAKPFAERLAKVDIEASFAMRPPSNWASVWLSGEWLRFREGLSPFTRERIDEWLSGFFEGHVDVEKGFYHEAGHPNSYDLFTRYHFADLLAEGYDGRWRATLERLMETGLQRSLAMQLSDGSLASAYRSTGQTWTLGIQCAYFQHAANFFKTRDPKASAEAATAARRALASFARFQRKDGPYSPVENCLPPAYRVGYEPYTADGNYGNLAMAFLGVAVANGLEDAPGGSFDRPAQTRAEGDPTHRAIAHQGRYSLHVNTAPNAKFDGFGLVDLTFGVGRYLQFAATVKFLGGGERFNLGIATRAGAGRTEIEPLAQRLFSMVEPVRQGPTPASLRFEARPIGEPWTYRFAAELTGSGAQIHESTPGNHGHKTLLIPYPRDPGTGVLTSVKIEPGEIRFTHGKEVVCVRVHGPVEFALDLPFGFEGRRGLCGMVRVDLRDAGESVRYDVIGEAL